MPQPVDGMVLPGQPLDIPAKAWSRLMEMLRAYERKRFNLGGMVESSLIQSKLTVLVKNTLSTFSDSFQVLKLGDSVVDVPGDVHQSNRRPAFNGETPDNETNAIAITQGPVETDGLIPACVEGVCLCRVRMNDMGHEYANPLAGETRFLDSTSSPGQARILGAWPEVYVSGSTPSAQYDSYDTDIFWALVKLSGNVFPTSTPIASQNPKVRVATVANGTLSASFENGDTVDGVTLATGDRILIKNQSTASENGVYIVAASGSPTRASDYDSGEEISGAIIAVTEGTHNGDTVWVCTSNHTTSSVLTVGTDAINWAFVGPVKNGISASSSPVSVSTNDTWYSGVTISLPGPGTYLINAAVNVGASVSAGGQGYVYFRLWNSTGSTVVSESFPLTIVQGPLVFQTYCFSAIVTVTVASTVAAQALRSSALATWVSVTINNSGVDARSNMNYLRVG